MPQNLINELSTEVHVMACCLTASGRYDVTRPHWQTVRQQLLRRLSNFEAMKISQVQPRCLFTSWHMTKMYIIVSWVGGEHPPGRASTIDLAFEAFPAMLSHCSTEPNCEVACLSTSTRDYAFRVSRYHLWQQNIKVFQANLNFH